MLNKLLGISFAVIAITLLVWFKISSLEADKADLNIQVAELTKTIEIINHDGEVSKKSYEEKLAKLPTEIEVIKTQYKSRYLYIQSWKGDSNASECNNTLSFLHSVNY